MSRVTTYKAPKLISSSVDNQTEEKSLRRCYLRLAKRIKSRAATANVRPLVSIASIIRSFNLIEKAVRGDYLMSADRVNGADELLQP